jgi:hypothetical protein
LYQVGTARLADLGLYTPAPGESLAGNAWQGQFNIPGFPNVRTQDDFRSNALAQQAAEDAEIAQARKAIADLGAAAQGYSETGLLAVAHLGGIGGMRRFVSSGGKYNPDDGDRSLADYYRAFSPYGSVIPGGVPQFDGSGGSGALTYRRRDLDASDTLSPSGGMVNDGRRSAEDIAKEIEGTRADTQQKLTAELAKIDAQLEQLRAGGQAGSTDYMGLLQREQETRGALYRNVDPQTQALREGQNQLDQQRLARRYGFTPAGDQLAATQAQAAEIARSTGDPATDDVVSQRTAQFYAKADMELKRLQDTQAATTAGNERLAKAYAEGGTAVADLTAINEALQQINLILPPTAAKYTAELDRQTESNRKLAQSIADVKAQEGASNDNRAIAAASEQVRLLNSGEGTNQQAQDFAAFQARQANENASPQYQDSVANAARTRTQMDQALAATKANYNELQSFTGSAFDRIGSDIARAFSSGKDAAISFSSVTKGLLADLEQEFVKLAVINPLKNALFGGSSPTLGGVGGLLGSMLGGGGGNGDATNTALAGLGGQFGPATASQVEAARSSGSGGFPVSGLGGIFGGIANSIFGNSASGSTAATNAALASLGGADGPATLAQVQAAQGTIANGASSGGVFDGIGSFFAGLFHSGGIVGATPNMHRMVDPSIFYGARRMHGGGIAGDETPAVLKAGEGVFTPAQMAALGPAGGNQPQGDVHFNIDARGAGPREIDQLRSQIPLMALATVQSAMTRGGSFAKAVRGG